MVLNTEIFFIFVVIRVSKTNCVIKNTHYEKNYTTDFT